MSYKNRWTQPTEREPRDEYYALRKELKTRALTKSRRAEIETRLDELALSPDFKGTLQEKSILSEVPPGKPTTPDLLALVARVEAVRESGSHSQGTPAYAGKRDLARKLDDAKKALEPQLKAKALHIDDTLCNIAEAHAKFAYELWTSRAWDELQRADKALVVTCLIKQWRNEPIFEKPTWADAAWGYFMQLPATEKLRQWAVFENSKTTPEQWKSTFEQLKIEERMKQPLPEKYLRNEPQAAPPQIKNDELTKMLDLAPTKAEPEPVSDPVRASADLAARAALVLQTDSWLSRLAEHSPDMRTKILASLSDELLRTGFVNGDFATRLYNDCRPRALSQFPPRQF